MECKYGFTPQGGGKLPESANWTQSLINGLIKCNLSSLFRSRMLQAPNGARSRLRSDDANRTLRFLFPKRYPQADLQAIEFSALASRVPRLPKRLVSGIRGRRRWKCWIPSPILVFLQLVARW